MSLGRLERNWERFARSDAMWAILTDPAKRDRRWATDEFFATGETEIAGLMAELDGLGVRVDPGAALDFGCGIGRLTQALADRFESVVGIDIAPTMIEQAREHNRHGDAVRYVQSSQELLPFDDATFDLVYSSLVLQHIRPEQIRGYLAEFLRVLRPGGVAVFQLPAVRLRYLGNGWRARSRRRVSRTLGRSRRLIRAATAPVELVRPRMEMNSLPRAEVERIVAASGGRTVSAVPDGNASDFAGFRYCVLRLPD